MISLHFQSKSFNTKVIQVYVPTTGLPPIEVKNLPANAEDIRDVGLIPGSETSPGGGQGTLIFLPGEFPWTEEPGRLQSMGFAELDVT